MQDYGGKKLHFIQIGLGTNCTFIHNLVGTEEDYNKSIGWIANSGSEFDPEKILGIAVEPVADLVDALRPLASKCPGVQLLQAAMGEHDESGAEMKGLPEAFGQAREELLDQVPPSKRQRLSEDLEYLRNMSCLGYVHPLFPMCKKSLEYNFDVKLEVGCNETVDVWSWAKLAKTFNFVGCEVVLIDAEGCDTKILRSLLAFGREHPEHFPNLIQVETMGHCDRQEGLGSEKAVLDSFQQEGYSLVSLSDHNSYLVLDAALSIERPLQKWVYKWYCYICYGQWQMPYISNKKGIFCEQCHDQLIEEGRSKPLKCGRKLDDLSHFSPIWGEKPKDGEWWDTGFHWRSLEWKPWEEDSGERLTQTADVPEWEERTPEVA